MRTCSSPAGPRSTESANNHANGPAIRWGPAGSDAVGSTTNDDAATPRATAVAAQTDFNARIDTGVKKVSAALTD